MKRAWFIGFAAVLIICAVTVRFRLVYAQSQNNILQYQLYPTFEYHTLKYPTGLLMSRGTLFIADTGNNQIRQFAGTTLSVLAGSGSRGYGDGTLTSAQFSNPTGLQGGAFVWTQQSTECDPTCGDPNCRLRSCYPMINHPYTRLYVADTGNYVVRMVCAGDPPATGVCNAGITSTVSTVVGNHVQGYVDGPSLSAEFRHMAGVFGQYSSPSPTAPFYIADAKNSVIRSWDGSNVSTYAGNGSPGYVNAYRTSAQFGAPAKAAWDANGNMYVADAGNNVIRKIDTSGNVTTFAGTGVQGYVDGPGSSAQFDMPCSIVFNPADNSLYVSDSLNSVIRKITLNGVVSTYAGSTQGQGGDVDGSLTQAKFQCPMDLVIVNGTMYVADALNNSIRAIDMVHGVVSTYVN
jgi:hypothetical protein